MNNEYRLRTCNVVNMPTTLYKILNIEICTNVDSHIQRGVLATEKTTVTQRVSHRPVKRQSRCSWSQRGTKVNGSHHGDSPLLKPTGIQLSTCPLHTNSGCGKREAHINRSMVACKMAALVTGTTWRTTGPVPADSRQ